MKATGPLGRCLRVGEAAAYLGITADQLALKVRRGLIVCHRDTPRGHARFYERELDQYLASTRVEATEATTRARGSVAHLMPPVREFQ